MTLASAVALTLISAYAERVGPAPASWRDELCSPFPLHPCTQGVLQGGWPFAFLLDSPGISRMGQLAFVEDRFARRAFLLDVGAYWAALFALVRFAASRRKPE